MCPVCVRIFWRRSGCARWGPICDPLAPSLRWECKRPPCNSRGTFCKTFGCGSAGVPIARCAAVCCGSRIAQGCLSVEYQARSYNYVR